LELDIFDDRYRKCLCKCGSEMVMKIGQ